MSKAELIPIAPRKLVDDDESGRSGAGGTQTSGAPKAVSASPATSAPTQDRNREKKDTNRDIEKRAVADTADAPLVRTQTPEQGKGSKRTATSLKKKNKKQKGDDFDLVTPVNRKKRRLIAEAMRVRRLTPEDILAAKRKKRIRAVRAVAASLLVVLLINGYFWVWDGPYAHLIFPPKAVEARQPKLNTGFNLAGVQFGMTPDMVEDIHTVTRRDQISEKDLALSFNEGSTPYTIWFRHDDGLSEAWKISYRQAPVAGGLDAVIAPVLAKLGPLYQSSCDTSALNSNTTCTFHWFGGEGVNVTVVAQITRQQGESLTGLVVTAEDRAVIERQIRAEDLRSAREKRNTPQPKPMETPLPVVAQHIPDIQLTIFNKPD